MNVIIKEAKDGEESIEQVIKGKADFGIAMSDLILHRAKGQPVVVLASIFQHSPLIILAPNASGIENIHALKGKRIGMETHSAELVAYLENEGIPLKEIELLPHDYSVSNVISGEVDAISAYSTDEPFMLLNQGVEYTTFSPRAGGIDFYGDTLFTSENQIKEHPERVSAFLAASLKGWQYALENSEEIIELILSKYTQRHSREHLLFEAQNSKMLIMADVVQLGYMNPGRWHHIAQTYANLRMIDKEFSLDGFLYDPGSDADYGWLKRILGILITICLLLGFGTLILVFFNRKLAGEVNERKRAEKAVRESEERFRSLFEQTAEAVFVHDLSGHIKDVNSAASEVWGYDRSEFLDLRIEDLDPDAPERGDKEIFWDQLEEKAPILFETRSRRKDGQLFLVEVSLSPIQFGGQRLVLAIARDISERKQAEKEKAKLEAQLKQAQKMEAIATLAGGLAHEFNNALMGVMGNIELLKMDLPEDERRDQSFEAMNESGHRMSRLTDQLLAYAEGGKYNAVNLKLDDFIIETLPILHHDLSPEVRVETHFSKDISYIRADYAQMQMVLSAIFTNSNEAIEDKGIIEMATENIELDEDFINQHPGLQTGLKPGPYVCLTIKDDGKGMDEEAKEGIFEPFFTTKFQGRGMGMAAVYGIIKSHDGAITVESEPGKGTVVRIYLPAVEPKVEAKEVKRPETAIAMGEGTILVIEDEEPLVDLLRQILERLGYRALLARTGKEAVELAKTFDGQIDLALLDIKLPDMDGGRVYPLIMEARPDLKVIVCSGYSIHGPAQDILDAGAEGFIQKPFSIAPFAEKLKEVLEGKTHISL